MTEIRIKDEEIEMLLHDVQEHYGYDFTGYARASLRRRITRLMGLDDLPSFAELRYKLLHSKDYLLRFVEELTVNVTEMFRDAHFYRTLREEVLPVLATYPLIRIWHAGCSTGEEVYSMAILLQECGLLHKSLLYATDINPDALSKGQQGIYRMQHMRAAAEGYIASGGREDFSKYYTGHYEHVMMDAALRQRMVFSTHNLVSDYSFNEFQLLLCRNVLIYFEQKLQDRACTLFDNSLEPLGYLALGARETLRFTSIHKNYTQLNGQRIWRKMKR